MFNTLSLTREIHRQHPTQLEAENPSLFLQLLFGVVCLQSAYPRLYDELVRHPNLYDWLDSSGGSDADEQGKLNVESFDDEDISPMDFDLNAFAQTDPWIRKRQTSAQKLVYSIFKLVMQDKYKKKSTYTDSADLHTTKDYLEQIIQTSRLTATEDEGAESFVCDTLDEFVAHCAENGTDEATLQEVRTFCRVLNKVFDDALTLEFTDDRVLFRATAPHSKLSKVISTAQVLTPLGILIRAGRSHKLGVVPAGKLRSMKVNRRVEHVQEFEERDINPIKARFKEITGVQRVSSRWVTVLQEEMHSDSDQPTSEAEETISENNVGTR